MMNNLYQESVFLKKFKIRKKYPSFRYPKSGSTSLDPSKNLSNLDNDLFEFYSKINIYIFEHLNLDLNSVIFIIFLLEVLSS
ncbi:hypothetical protein BpHYR1_036125 [Brachionus plicatilis]|uniref:Uncharacterized protein n=1 Tax=Brachionus plicatilis TaxID=10195 RepID=A0A3M7S5D2_BRAPC|nr:hypothetical protein BpHYR1_036125 [Brachionus plicatilis]